MRALSRGLTWWQKKQRENYAKRKFSHPYYILPFVSHTPFAEAGAAVCKSCMQENKCIQSPILDNEYYMRCIKDVVTRLTHLSGKTKPEVY